MEVGAHWSLNELTPKRMIMFIHLLAMRSFIIDELLLMSTLQRAPSYLSKLPNAFVFLIRLSINERHWSLNSLIWILCNMHKTLLRHSCPSSLSRQNNWLTIVVATVSWCTIVPIAIISLDLTKPWTAREMMSRYWIETVVHQSYPNSISATVVPFPFARWLDIVICHAIH